MQVYTVAVLLVGVLVFVLNASTSAALAIDCDSTPHAKKVCEYLVVASNIVDGPEGLMERDPQQKRQDVDHVFLRFGRRYGFY